jgi:flagellar hook protein FlgE
MGTAIYTGVTGLLAHQRRLDVVANNIANVNTTGYRGARMLFQDLFSQTLQGARAPVGALGGTNPMQIGLGVRIASIDTNFNQGALVTTGVASDLAIQGSGFFILSNGTGTFYSRDGSFTLNADGVLIDPATELSVQGYRADAQGVIDVNSGLMNLIVPVGGTAIVKPTENVDWLGNLSSDADPTVPDTVVRNMRVYDSLGTARDITVTFTKDPAVNLWTWGATYDNGTSVVNLTTSVPAQIQFDNSGAVLSGALGTVTLTAADLGTPPGQPVDPFTFNVNFTNMSQLAGTSDVSVSNQDGFPRGVLESFNIGEDGTINGVFTNGLTRVIGQVALANFSNVGGMSRVGNNLFRDTPASGIAQVGLPNTGGRGSVSGGVLEGSNVDLGTEFSNMIITQRGFQANARTITAADTLLQETVNLIR